MFLAMICVQASVSEHWLGMVETQTFNIQYLIFASEVCIWSVEQHNSYWVIVSHAGVEHKIYLGGWFLVLMVYFLFKLTQPEHPPSANTRQDLAIWAGVPQYN